MSKSLFENDQLDYIKMDEAKINCLNYFGYRLSLTKTAYINSDRIPSHVLQIKEINKISLVQLFDKIMIERGLK